MKALVVIDYQNDYVVGPLSTRFTQMIEGNICQRIEETLSAGGDVYFVMDMFNENYLQTPEGKRNPIKHCIRGTAGQELFGKMNNYVSKAKILRKDTPGCEELFGRLRHYGEIELCGVETDKDIIANAIIARSSNPNARIIVRQNCVASRDSLMADEASDIMRGLGIEVM